MKMLRRSLLPGAVFLGTMALHFFWTGWSLGRACAQESRLTGQECCAPSWWTGYVETQGHWLGYSYALPLAFASAALRRYRETQLCAARTFAVGGVTLSGFLAVLGCFLAGCCGSPMLAVYLSLFGTAFLPLAKPMIAIFATLSIVAGWWWLRRQCRGASASVGTDRCLSQGGCANE